MTDSPATPHFTILHAEEVIQRTKAKELRLQSAALRTEAKGMPPEKANPLRQQAKKLSEEAAALQHSTKLRRLDAIRGLGVAAHEMTRRMPEEFAEWGAMKTRGYAKLLGLLASQASRIHPNLLLASRAFVLLCSHSEWTDDEANRFGSLPKSPKKLPELLNV